MALTINLRHLEKKSLHLAGELSADELELGFQDEVIQTPEPLHYDLTVERLPESLLVRGDLWMNLRCECVRCLKVVECSVEINGWAADLPLEGEDQVPVNNDLVDLTPLIREDILLEFPQHPLCQTECSGLPSAPQNDSQPRSGANDTGDVSSAWAELNKLKF